MAITLARSSIAARPTIGRASATRTVRARAAVAPVGIRTPLRVTAGIRMPKALSKTQEKMGKMSVEHLAAFGALSALTTANPCLALSELAEVAEVDNRLSIFFLLFGPVLGWVTFNILGPATSQLDNMSQKNKALVAGMGLSAAALLAAPHAEAAQEFAQVAEIDQRLGIFLLLFAPVLGWVGFNIIPGFINQIDEMKNKGLVAGMGLSGAALLAAPHAEAAQEFAQVAEIDQRLGIFLLLFAPVLGWVGFNIIPGFINQIDEMKNKGLVAGMGLSAAALLAAPHAEAAQEFAQVAEIDQRLGIFLLLFAPVLGWVGFNIIPGFINQIDEMKNK